MQVLLLSFLAMIGVASANPLKIELVSSTTSVQPGRPFYVGLHLQHPPGYHSYWKVPGIVGIPTAIKWDLPPGWKAGEIEWPAPERVMMFAIKAQGFHGEKLLPIKVTPPADLRVGGTVMLGGKAHWMCCGRDCNPGFADLSIELPVSASVPIEDGRWRALFAASAKAVAKPSAEWVAEAAHRGNEIVVRVKPNSPGARSQFMEIKEVTFFTEDGVIDPNQPGSQRKTGTEFILTQTVSEFAPKPFPREMIGILQTPTGWLPGDDPKSIRIVVPLRKKE